MMQSTKVVLVMICLFSLPRLCSGQFKGHDNKIISAEYIGGFIFEHKAGISHLITHHPVGLRIDFDRETYGGKPWQQRYNFPDIGFTAIYLDYKNPVIGKSIAIIPHYKAYINKNKQAKNQFHYTIGFGAEYNTEKYDRETNNKNNLLSTDINGAVLFEAGYRREVTPQLFFLSSISLTHFSNGSLKKPNSGINIVSANAGIAYKFNYQPKEYIFKDEPKAERSVGFTATLASGMHAYSRQGTGQHPFFVLSGTVDKRLNHKSALGLAVEWFGSLSMREDIKYDWHLMDEPNKPSWMRLGVAFSHELFVSRLSVLTQAGYYVFDEYDYFGKMYLRIGLRRYFKNKMYTSILLKSHGAKAEAFEFGIGYRFK
ncbi:acyloxyacyl hydrolase [Fulvivirga ligni]|uniref:acyloxyacyl hydrolase n=1 Tax=Fulvivirga ligni TaxID=2904246 RepID=UPI001F3E8397|nr:acyloxyacyl hydrolase [Fulvivirga ligni]UII23249.1 acyloxyacyl hydrolase [Fulvivirga ligni]